LAFTDWTYLKHADGWHDVHLHALINTIT
jgi:hypothetical protein